MHTIPHNFYLLYYHVSLSHVLSLSLSLSLFHTHSPPSLCPSGTATGSAGKHWRNEKIFTVGLLGLIPLGLVYPSAVVDYGLAVAIPLHGHWSVRCSGIYLEGGRGRGYYCIPGNFGEY